jgi:hypothetical protein
VRHFTKETKIKKSLMILKNILPVIVVTLVMGLLLVASKKKPKKDEIVNLTSVKIKIDSKFEFSYWH